MDEIVFNPIGIIHSPFNTLKGMPIQPTGAKGVAGEVHVLDEFREGLMDLGGFSHIFLIYHFHKSEGCKLKVKPFMDTVNRGLFATRAPRRPNRVGLSIVRLIKIEANILHVKDVDILDGTPLLDIKPYVSKFDAPPADRFGWLEDNSRKAEHVRADERFIQNRE